MQGLGVDLSKDKFDVALIVDERNPGRIAKKTFSNDSKGFAKLSEWLEPRADESLHVVMEATGSYWEALATYLQDRGIRVSVVNPALIKREAQSWGMRNKTDGIDAEIIARYCIAKRPKPWIAPIPELRELREMVRHLDCLEEEKRRLENRLGSAAWSETVRASLMELVESISAEITAFEDRIRKHIDNNPTLKSDSDLLKSIPGIGAKTAALLLAELQHVRNFASAKQVAAYAGVSPRRIQSGVFKGTTRMCKFGNARLRRALYFPAIVASIWNPVIKAFYTRLLAHNRCRMSAIGACMRKLLAIAYGVLKTRTPFAASA